MKTKVPVLFVILFTLAGLGVFSTWAFIDDNQGLLSLHALEPFLSPSIALGSLYFENARKLVPILAGLCASILLLLPLFRPRSGGSLLVYLALICGLGSQGALLFGYTIEGSLGYLLTLIIALIGMRRSKDTNSFFSDRMSEDQFSWNECLWLCLIITVALVFRYYALNRVVNFMEGELSPYAAGSTSLGGIPVANKGINGPWAPLGLLYYPPIYIATRLFGTTILSIRMSSAIVGVITVPILYLFLRQIGGSLCAIIGAALFSLNSLHIGWSRTDIHPHGVTTWPTLLLCWALFKALHEKKNIYFALTALLMGLTWHQYPSGQSAVSIPIFTVGLYAFTHGFHLPCKKRQLGWILCGMVLWIIGLPLSYYLADGKIILLNPFTLTSQRTSWGNTSSGMGFVGGTLFVISMAWQHFVDVIQSITIKVPYLFHQDFIPEVPGFGSRTVPFLIVPLLVVGIAMLTVNLARIEVLILTSWMIAAILPGILSERAYAKRLSTFFPALDCLAALVLTWIICDLSTRYRFFGKKIGILLLGVSLLCFSTFSMSAWFSGKQFHYGEPPEVAVINKLAEFVEPQTLIIGDLWKDYDEGKILFLLMDKLSDPSLRPNALHFTRPDIDPIHPYISDPRKIISSLKRDPARWWYTWTRLELQFNETVLNQDWKKVLFILQDRIEPEGYTQSVIKDINEMCRNKVEVRFETKGSVSNPLIAIQCDL